jgi:S-adenosylmethionine hydrolase
MTYLLQKSHRWKARILDNPDFHASSVSPTFHGRDIFAPVAAHLARGVKFDGLGTPVTEVAMLKNKPVLMGDEKINGRIIHIDSFGNLITNVRRDHFQWSKLEPANAGMLLGINPVTEYVEIYSAADEMPVMLFGSNGYLEVAYPNGSAADYFSVKAGQEISITDKRKLKAI